jgi:hypothetical protein
MRFVEKVQKMAVALGLLGVFVLLSLAGTDLLIAGISSDELERMGLEPE